MASSLKDVIPDHVFFFCFYLFIYIFSHYRSEIHGPKYVLIYMLCRPVARGGGGGSRTTPNPGWWSKVHFLPKKWAKMGFYEGVGPRGLLSGVQHPPKASLVTGLML